MNLKPVKLMKAFVSGCIVLFILMIAAVQLNAQSLIDMKFIGRYESGFFDEGGTEICTYDAATSRIFSVNGATGNIDIISIADPSNPSFVSAIDLSSYGSGANSVTIHNGIIAAAVQANEKTDPGKVVFIDVNGNIISSVNVGALPDMITYTNNGAKVLVACEGEPNDDYTIDPIGQIAIISVPANLAAISPANVTLLDFSVYNNNPVPGVRVFGPGATFAQDMEPEYITVSDDSKTAWVTLQENNAIAKINLMNNSLIEVLALGFKDYSLPGNGIDASDRNSGTINIANWPVKGMYQPDAIGSYSYLGSTFLVTANEGDVREWDGYAEIERVKDITLDPVAFPDYEMLQEDSAIGRLNISTAYGDVDNDGDFDELYSYGARSFSIWNANGDLVFDSGDYIEHYIAGVYPDFFNVSSTNNTKQNRSDDKGPEPEGLTVVTILDSVFAFVGLERIGGIMAFNITDPANPRFVDYINTRDFAQSPGPGYTADLGPEGLLFIPWNKNPNRKNLLVVSNEISGTLSIYETDVLCGNKKVLVCLNGVTHCANEVQLAGYIAAGGELGPCANPNRMHQVDEVASVVTFPNPANDKIFFQMNNLQKGNYVLNIFDNNGRLIQSNSFVQTSSGELMHEIDLRSYPNGIFGYTFSGDSGTNFSGNFPVVK